MVKATEDLRGRKASVERTKPGPKPTSGKGGTGKKPAKAKARGKGVKGKRKVDLEYEDGKELLQRAAHRAAAEKSDAIAEKLAEKAALGNADAAKMLITLMDGKLPPRKLRPGELTCAQRLALEPEWVGPPEDDDDDYDDEDDELESEAVHSAQ
jgi:hypothetical protein